MATYLTIAIGLIWVANLVCLLMIYSARSRMKSVLSLDQFSLPSNQTLAILQKHSRASEHLRGYIVNNAPCLMFPHGASMFSLLITLAGWVCVVLTILALMNREWTHVAVLVATWLACNFCGSRFNQNLMYEEALKAIHIEDRGVFKTWLDQFHRDYNAAR